MIALSLSAACLAVVIVVAYRMHADTHIIHRNYRIMDDECVRQTAIIKELQKEVARLQTVFMEQGEFTAYVLGPEGLLLISKKQYELLKRSCL